MKKSDVKCLVITGFGLNCERETAAACQLAGAKADKVHLNDKGAIIYTDFVSKQILSMLENK